MVVIGAMPEECRRLGQGGGAGLRREGCWSSSVSGSPASSAGLRDHHRRPVVTDDGRIAAGAVPQQVLVDALEKQ